MEGWDGRMSKESAQAAALYAFWLDELRKAYYAPKVPEAPDSRGRRPQRHRRDDPRSCRSRARTGSAPIRPAGGIGCCGRRSPGRSGKTKAALGDDPAGWAWGKLHHVHFKHPLAARGAAYGEAFNLGPVPSGSGPYTPDQARYDKDFARQYGASYRQVFDLADWDRGMATSAPGQSGQPGSPHYADLLPLWRDGRYFPLAFSRHKVEQVTRHRLLLAPAGSCR